MPIFEIEKEGRRFQVEAPDIQAAHKAATVYGGNAGAESPHMDKSVAFEGGVLGNLPIVGPAIKGGAQRLAAGLRSITPGGKSYGEELKTVQDYAAGAEKRHPLATAGGGLTGGIAGTAVGAAVAPTLFGMGGTTLPGQIGRQVLSGAGIGAADAAIRGENPIVGGGVGAAGGVVGPLVGRGISEVAKTVARDVRGAVNPTAEAARQIVATQQVQGGSRGLTPQQFSQAKSQGIPVINLHVGGEPTTALARSAANISPQARDTLFTAVDQRYQQQAQRINSWFDKNTPFRDAVDLQGAIDRVEQTTNAQAYKRAYEQGAKGLWSPELERLSGSKAVSGAMKGALETMRDEAIIKGYGPMRPPFRVDAQGGLIRERSPTGIPIDPDLRFWDLTRRKIGDAAINAGRGTDEARRLNSFASSLNKELDRLVPAYQQARSGAAAFFGAENALEAGQKAAVAKARNSELRAGFNKMSPTEKDLFRQGYLSKKVAQINEIPDRLDAAKKLAQSPGERERMEMILGKDKTKEFLAMLHIEGAMNIAREAIKGNSSTVRQFVELGIVTGAVAGADVYSQGLDFLKNPTTAMQVMLLAGVAKGRSTVAKNVANEVARLLTSDNPALVQRGITLVAHNNKLMESLASIGVRGAGGAAADAAMRLQITVPVPYGQPQERRQEESGQTAYGGPQQ